MIIVKLIGGLGNQMFQYAAGRSLALRNGCQLKLDISGFEDYGLHNGYELSLFNIKAEIASKHEVRRLAGSRSRLARLLQRKLGLRKKTCCVETSFSFAPGFFEISAPAYLDGYWQSYRYFEPVAAQIREELTFVSPPRGRNAELAELISRVNAVSIHVRRGDYVTSKAASAVHGFVGAGYYKDATHRILDEVASPHFFVFSDDLAWAREHLGLVGNATFVDHNSGVRSYEDMRLMSLCQHHIIANSTFSWWAAWSGYRPGKRVFYPQNWFATPEKDISSLCPPEWTRINPASPA